MTEREVYDALNEVFRKQFKDDSLNVYPEMTAGNVDGWDSLAHIRLILGVEKRLGVKFKTSEVGAFENVGDLVRLVLAKYDTES